MTPEHEIMATNSTNSKTISDLGVATNPCMMPLDDQEAMTKAMARLRRVGWLAKHHHAHSAAMTGTAAPHHTMLRRGHKTMTIAMPERAPQDGVTCKPS